jgi:sigma-B regulation protein RsbU (phosphoserine phosphatase)
MIRALVEELKPEATDPGTFLSKLNNDLYAILKHTGTPMLTTAFYLVADWKAGTMRYANAGHPKPLHVRRSADKVQALTNAGGKGQPALGLVENTVYETTVARIDSRDLVMLFTDGLYEVQGAESDFYTQALLSSAVQSRAQRSASEIFDQVLQEIRGFSQGNDFIDDVCLVGMEVTKVG